MMIQMSAGVSRPRKGAWIEIQIEVLGNPSGASPPQGGVD